MAQLRRRQADLELTGARVRLIAFDAGRWAEAWLQQTGAPWPLLLDPERVAYRRYGLGRSLRGSWGPRVWIAYARLMMRGEPWRGILGDSAQLGGDFIVGPDGLVRFAHRSHDPTDRPAVADLLGILTRPPRVVDR